MTAATAAHFPRSRRAQSSPANVPLAHGGPTQARSPNQFHRRLRAFNKHGRERKILPSHQVSSDRRDRLANHRQPLTPRAERCGPASHEGTAGLSSLCLAVVSPLHRPMRWMQTHWDTVRIALIHGSFQPWYRHEPSLSPRKRIALEEESSCAKGASRRPAPRPVPTEIGSDACREALVSFCGVAIQGRGSRICPLQECRHLQCRVANAHAFTIGMSTSLPSLRC